MKSKLSIILILSVLFVALCPLFARASAQTYEIVCAEEMKFLTGSNAGMTYYSIYTFRTQSPLSIYKKVEGDSTTLTYFKIGDSFGSVGYSNINATKVTTWDVNKVLTSNMDIDACPFYGSYSVKDANGIKQYTRSSFVMYMSDSYYNNGTCIVGLKNGATVAEIEDSNPNNLKFTNPLEGAVIKDVNTDINFKIKGFDGYKLAIKYYVSTDGTNWNYAGLVPKYINAVFNTVYGQDWSSYTLYGNELPWQNGYIKYEFIMYLPTQQPSTSTNIYTLKNQVNAQKSYVKIIKPASNTIEIPILTIQKVNYEPIIDYYINGVFYGTLIEKNISKNILPKSADCQVGSNTITIKNKTTSAEIMSETFYLNANEQGQVESNINQDVNDANQLVDSTGKPIKPTGGNIIDWIIYGFNYTGWAINSVGSGISTIISTTSGFGSLITVWFNFMPPEYSTLILLAISLAIILRIFDR